MNKFPTYYKDGKPYRKLERHEVIAEGAMQSLCHGELIPIMNTDGKTIGGTPADFSPERDFYNPIDETEEIELPNSMPEPGSAAYESMIDFMRADLESGMGYSKIIAAAKKNIEADGRNFDEEFEKWKRNKNKKV